MILFRLFLVGACLMAVQGASFAQPAAQMPDHYEIDTGHSSILFKVKRNGVSNFFGRFNKFSGTIDLLEKGPKAQGQIELSIAVQSLDTGISGRDDKLRGDKDLFAAVDFPEVKFSSTEIRKTARDRFLVKGQLSFRGVTQPISFAVQRIGQNRDDKGGGMAGFEAVVRFSRSRFGMTGMDKSIGDEAEVTVSLACGLKPPAKTPAVDPSSPTGPAVVP